MAPELTRFQSEVGYTDLCLGYSEIYSRRYASDLTPDQKDALLDVTRANPHPQISPEIRRELVNSVERGAPRPDADGDIDMS